MRRSVEMALAPRHPVARWIEVWWLAAALLAAAAQVNAQPAPPAPPAPAAAPAAPIPPAGQPLRQQVEARFEVLPVSDGLLLKPRQDMDGIRALEVRDGQLAIDGREAEIIDLERRIGRQAAAPVRALLELDPDELEEIFGLAAVAMPEADDDADVDALRQRLDSERDRLESEMEARRAEIERQQEEIRARIEREMSRHGEDQARTAEEIARDVQRDVQRDIDRAIRRRGHRDSDARVVMGTPVRVEKGESTGNVVSIGGGVTVDGEVLGNAVAIGGSNRISGVVTGNAVTVGGSVRLGPTARVMGDVVSVGGTVEKAPGAEIMGQVTEVSLWQAGILGNFGDWDWPRGGQPDYFDGALFDFLSCVVFVLVLMLLGALVAAIARNPLDRTAAAALGQPWKSAVVGILAVLLFLPAIIIVIVLLAVSIIGIPLLLLVPFALLGCVLASFFGYLGAAQALARWSEGRFGWRLRGPVTTILLGLFLLHGAWLMARLVDVVDSPKDVGGFLRLMLMLFWILVNLCAAFVGIGAVIVARRSGPAPVQPYAAVPPPAPPPSPAPYEPYGRELTATTTPAPAPESAKRETEVEAEDWDEPFADFDEPRTATAATLGPASSPIDAPEPDADVDEDEADRERRQA